MILCMSVFLHKISNFFIIIVIIAIISCVLDLEIILYSEQERRAKKILFVKIFRTGHDG